MRYKAEDFASAIIVVGAFNPAIISPEWLRDQKLIGPSDVEVIQEGGEERQFVMSRQVTAIETEWFVLQVDPQRLRLASKGVLSPPLKDLVVGIFTSLPHTPVTAVGMNFMAHYQLDGERQWHDLGDALAPKAVWNSLCPGEHAGLGNLTIAIERDPQANRGKLKDVRNVSVQPSNKLKYGAFLTYNHHRDIAGDDDSDGELGTRVAQVIDDGWEGDWHEAERIFEGVLINALGE